MRPLLAIPVLLAGCFLYGGRATVLSQTPQGGEIEVAGDFDRGKKKAVALMEKHCATQGFWIENAMQWKLVYHCGADPRQNVAPGPQGPQTPCKPKGAIVDHLSECCAGSVGDAADGGRFRCG